MKAMIYMFAPLLFASSIGGAFFLFQWLIFYAVMFASGFV